MDLSYGRAKAVSRLSGDLCLRFMADIRGVAWHLPFLSAIPFKFQKGGSFLPIYPGIEFSLDLVIHADGVSYLRVLPMKALVPSKSPKLVYLILFSVSLLANLYYGIVVQGTYTEGDEHWYYDLGLTHIKYISRGEFTFATIPGYSHDTNPPLSKIILGLLRVLLGFFGFDSYPLVARVQTSIAIALTGLIVYDLGCRQKSRFSGLLAWLLFTPSFILVPYEYWVSPELNGFRISLDWSYGFTRIQDTACMMFLSLSVYFLVRGNRGTILSGISYGLASITKYTALPIIPTLHLLYLLSKRECRSKILQEFTKLLIIGSFVFLLGNPLLWGTDRVAQTISAVRDVQEFKTRLSEALWNMVAKDFDYYLFRLLIHIIAFPVGLFIEMYLVQLFVVILLWRLFSRGTFEEWNVFNLEWASAVFLTLSMIGSIAIGTWIISYYAILLLPPLSLFCSLALSDGLETFLKSIFPREWHNSFKNSS